MHGLQIQGPHTDQGSQLLNFCGWFFNAGGKFGHVYMQKLPKTSRIIGPFFDTVSFYSSCEYIVSLKRSPVIF